jgi:hypothetical protein
VFTRQKLLNLVTLVRHYKSELIIVDKFTLPPAALPIGDASLTHVIKLAAHSTTSATPTAMRQSFIMTPYIGNFDISKMLDQSNLSTQRWLIFWVECSVGGYLDLAKIINGLVNV